MSIYRTIASFNQLICSNSSKHDNHFKNAHPNTLLVVRAHLKAWFLYGRNFDQLLY